MVKKGKSKGRAAASKMMNAVGITKNGIKVSNLVAFGSIASTALIPTVYGTDGKAYSAIQVLAGQGAFASISMSNRAQVAVAAITWIGIGYRVPNIGGATFGMASATGYTNGMGDAHKGLAALGVGVAVMLRIAGKWVNAYLSGLPIKL